MKKGEKGFNEKVLPAILTHDFSDSDHCKACGAEEHESPAYYLPCRKDFIAEENCLGCLGKLSLGDRVQGYDVCFECTKARHNAVLRRKCVCGVKRRPSIVYRIGSRTWISCYRCLGQIKQLS
jgi:hypothetical protein